MKVKILVECHHLLGDVVIMMPFLQALHNWRPDAEIHMIVGGKNEECEKRNFIYEAGGM